jgi:hypothetical protein
MRTIALEEHHGSPAPQPEIGEAGTEPSGLVREAGQEPTSCVVTAFKWHCPE